MPFLEDKTYGTFL